MKQFTSFIRKEFHHIFRDRRTMFILLFMPVAQIIIFGFALTNEVKNSQIAILDNAKDADAASLITQIGNSRYFNIEKTLYTQKEIDERTVNLMFFGNFYKMKLDEYAKGMQLVMEDTEFLYGSLIKDVYSQGVVLGRKYKLLRISYSIFMFGLVIAVLSFIIAIVNYYSHQQG